MVIRFEVAGGLTCIDPVVQDPIKTGTWFRQRMR